MALSFYEASEDEVAAVSMFDAAQFRAAPTGTERGDRRRQRVGVWRRPHRIRHTPPHRERQGGGPPLACEKCRLERHRHQLDCRGAQPHECGLGRRGRIVDMLLWLAFYGNSFIRVKRALGLQLGDPCVEGVVARVVAGSSVPGGLEASLEGHDHRPDSSGLVIFDMLLELLLEVRGHWDATHR